MAFRQNSSNVVIWSVVSEVRPVKEVSSRRRCRATWMARLVGTLVKRETTSKEIRVSLSLRVCEDMNVAKSVELRTLWLVLPTSGAKILERCLDNWYVGEDTKETIGLRGVSGL